MSNSPTEDVKVWVARSVQQAITDSGRSKRSVSDETGIAYQTLNRKLAAKGDTPAFTFPELYRVATALGVSPAQFTPPIFTRNQAAA